MKKDLTNAPVPKKFLTCAFFQQNQEMWEKREILIDNFQIAVKATIVLSFIVWIDYFNEIIILNNTSVFLLILISD